MALILSLETSSSQCSVALHKEGELVNTLEVHEPQAHAAKLAVLINEIFDDTRWSISSLNAVAVSAGPGSYTGLRIGTATAKGICYALNIPFIAIPTLDLLAFQFIQSQTVKNYVLCPMIDAKRMEVYYQVVTEDMEVIKPVDAMDIDQTSFSELLKAHKVFFFGDGSSKCKNMITHENAFFVSGITPKASALGVMAFSKYRKKIFEDIASFTPLYFKEFIAKKAKSIF